ncbi:hypothetical protein N7466_010408 [Penicillium verhagenii]|uniref:uncharacterized protein n=1 Tax=Penicillium verhagenii TaxID=1562060 RepID=UPI002545ACFA|nr:uncharacterized protein N7466_010408 [Penicillium verhagenii]KAJ5918416.1 hypothetical protein N7466_010408 [Penicillium verhagenii]
MGRSYSVFIAALAAMGSFLFGYDSGVMTDVIDSTNFLQSFHTTQTSAIIGAINSTYSGGAMIGAFQGGYTVDRFGRKITIQMGALICLVGATLQAAAQNLPMILVGRILAGWGVGIMSMAVPVYQAEFAHPRSRGLIVGLSQQMIGIGFIVSTWVGYGSLRAPNSSQLQWRLPLAFQVIPALILVIGMTFVPESPRFLIEKGRHTEAMCVLRKLHSDGTNDEWIEAEFNNICQAHESGKSAVAPGWVSMFTVPKWRTRMLHGLAVQVFTQMTGVNVITYYQTIMYKALGITGGRDTLIAGVYNCVGPLANLIFVVFFLDRVGRRKPLLFGTVAISIALACEAILAWKNPNGERIGYSIGGVFFIFAVSVAFSVSFGPCSWVYMAEVMPMQIRGKGNAFSVGIGNWAVSTVWNQVSPTALGQIQWRFYFVFVAWNLCVTFPIIYFFFLETKQKTLEEIDDLFDRSDRIPAVIPVESEKVVLSNVEHAL